MNETLIWKIAALGSDLASVRYRALLPALGLQSAGIRSRFTATARLDLLQDARAVVIVKSFAADDVLLASKAKGRGVPVFYDLCDNIFVPGYRGKGELSPAQMFLRIVEFCSAVTVPTAALRDVVTARVPKGTAVIEIPDCAETVQERADAISLFEHSNAPFDTVATTHATLATRIERSLRGLLRSARARFRKRLAEKSSSVALKTNGASWRHGDRPILLWFGNRGNTYTKSGLGDLLVFKEALAKAGHELGAELLVISNGKSNFEAISSEIEIRCHYEEWTLSVMEEALSRATVVLVPNSIDEFSACKSANRSLLALKRGVPVVASPTRALVELRDCVWQQDALEGIRLFVGDRKAARRWVARAVPLLEKRFSVRSVGRQWQAVIDSYTLTNDHRGDEPRAELFFAIGLSQDLDIIAPILAGAREREIECFVYVALTVVQTSARAIRYLAENQIGYAVLPDKFDAHIADAVVRRHKAGFFPSETSLNPHRFSHRLCKFARRAGRPTFTIQHGIDNVGLTYSDDIHKAEDISILSRTIFLWGTLDLLHPKVRPEVRERCISVGCPKPAHPPQVPIDMLIREQRPIVGVFENLHWHRYSDEYRSRFLVAIAECARQRPDLAILVKPHNAGMWLTARYKGESLKIDNVIVADPAQPEWEHFTAPQLLSYLTCVVTTPSTVALDSARAGLPTAVMRFESETSRYAPLRMIDSVEDLLAFVGDAERKQAREELAAANTEFIARHVRSGDAVTRILDTMQRQISAMRANEEQICSTAS